MIATLHALGWSLLHFAWVGTLLAASVPVLERALALRTAAARCALATVVLFAMPFAFALTCAAVWPAPRVAAMAVRLGRAGTGEVLVAALAAVWALGAALQLVRLAGGVWALHRTIARATALDRAWHDTLARIAARLDVRGRVSVAVSARVDVPMLAGILRPVVLLPAALVAGAPAPVVEAALAHELAHLRRHDTLVNALQLAVEALLFYHPGVRWLGARVRAERENACDDLVVERVQDRLDYAWALTEIEGLRGSVPQPALGATGGSLVQRIHRLVDPAGRPTTALARAASSLLALACLAALAVPACVALAPDDAEVERTAPAPAPAVPTAAAPGEPAAPDRIDIAWLPASVRAHEQAIVAAARRHGVDPELVAIMTWVESGGDAAARSPMGARGLMQLMPKTAERIAAERGLDGHDVTRLDDPAYNLELGSWYLAKLLDTYGGDELDEHAVEVAAAAYNGGERSAEAWLSGRAELSDETASYKDRVTALWRARDDAEAPARAMKSR
jgi:soluble lytic murein transglycosylase-like protein